MSILDLIKTPKSVADVYEAVKDILANDILYSKDDIQIMDNGKKSILSNEDRLRVAKGLQSIIVDSGIDIDNDETVEGYVAKAALVKSMHDSEELEALREKAKDLGL